MKFLLALFLALPVQAMAFTCGEAGRTAALRERLAVHYGDVAGVDCAGASGPTAMICDNPSLREMQMLAAQAWVYATESATGLETDHGAPEPDPAAEAELAACADAACLCDALIAQINGNMGGDNPYASYQAP